MEEPMGEGRAPDKEMRGWGNRFAWNGPEPSDVGLDILHEKWSKNPNDHIHGAPLIQVGITDRHFIPIYASSADSNPENTDGILLRYENRDTDIR
jgi:hypothetical protein